MRIDPDPDGIGIYAGRGATRVVLQVGPRADFAVHLIAAGVNDDDTFAWCLRIRRDPGTGQESVSMAATAPAAANPLHDRADSCYV
ncbi:hypothetical protein KKG45_04885 [bacterium]|nr:hypothetical protein [bacterium]MBU1072563.1 hypothetical protein [bacterium]MBU1675179.1 hypothetical protein [bacterium]